MVALRPPDPEGCSSSPCSSFFLEALADWTYEVAVLISPFRLMDSKHMRQRATTVTPPMVVVVEVPGDGDGDDDSPELNSEMNTM